MVLIHYLQYLLIGFVIHYRIYDISSFKDDIFMRKKKKPRSLNLFEVSNRYVL